MHEVAGEGHPPAEVDGALVGDSRAVAGGAFLGTLGRGFGIDLSFFWGGVVNAPCGLMVRARVRVFG